MMNPGLKHTHSLPIMNDKKQVANRDSIFSLIFQTNHINSNVQGPLLACCKPAFNKLQIKRYFIYNPALNSRISRINDTKPENRNHFSAAIL